MVQGIYPSPRRHPFSQQPHWTTLAVVSKCHNPRCSAEFRYFGDGKLFEFTADSIRETSQLYWLCAHCSKTYTLQRDSDGQVQFLSKQKQKGHALKKRSAGLKHAI